MTDRWRGLWAFPPYRWFRQSICPHSQVVDILDREGVTLQDALTRDIAPNAIRCLACGAREER